MIDGAGSAAVTGDFDIHLTVRTLGVGGVGEHLAARHGLKLTEIQLDRGRTPVQPMFTGTSSGDLGGQQRSLVREVLTRELNELGAAAFTPDRVRSWRLDDEHFHDHPHRIDGDLAAWTERLAVALERSYRASS